MIKGKIGCEIECIAKRENSTELETLNRLYGWRVSSDGSIGRVKRGEVAYEFKSKVYDIEQLDELITATTAILKLVRVNNTCGLHIHLSFKNIVDYYKICNWNFVSSFQELIRQKAKTALEKSRISNHYCQFYSNKADFEQTSEDQLISMGKSGSRYRAVNFNAYNLYKTVEFRIFAATSKIKKFEADINLLLKTVEKFLNDKENLKQFEITQYSDEIKPTKPKDRKILIKDVIKRGK